MDSNLNTEHTLLCTTSATKSQQLQQSKTSTMHCSCSFGHKAFDAVNIHKLTHKLTLTNISNIITKFIENYTKGQQACTQYNLKVCQNCQNSNKST